MADNIEWETESTTWQGDDYPPEGLYKLILTNGRELIRHMTPDWVWDDSWDGARIDQAYKKKE